MKKNKFLWKNEIFDIKMQFSSILRKTIQLDQKWCNLAEIWSRSSQDGNKQFQVAFCWYLQYFLRYGIFLVKICQKRLNFAKFQHFWHDICHISRNIKNIKKSYLELFVTILGWSWPNFSKIAPFLMELNRFA